MNSKEYIEDIILEQYYKLAVNSLFEQTTLNNYKLRSVKVKQLTTKQKAVLNKLPGGVSGFQIVATGRNLKDNFSMNQVVRSIQSSRQFGDESAYGISTPRLFVIDKVDLKKKENRKQIYVIYITKLDNIDISTINKLSKVGNVSYIITLQNFPSVNPKLAKNIKTVTPIIKVNIQKNDDDQDPITANDEKEAEEKEKESPTSTGVPSLSKMKLVNNQDMKKSDTGGFANLKTAFEGDVDGDYANTKSTLLSFLKPFQSIPGFGFTSTKRDSKLTKSGRISDHWEKNPAAYGIDIALKNYAINVGSEKDKDVVKNTIGDKIFLSIMKAIGRGIPTKGDTFNSEPIPGYRFQILWRTKDHYDHIHIGLKNKVAFKEIEDSLNNTTDTEIDDTTTTNNQISNATRDDIDNDKDFE